LAACIDCSNKKKESERRQGRGQDRAKDLKKFEPAVVVEERIDFMYRLLLLIAAGGGEFTFFLLHHTDRSNQAQE
jgi:hypothetical protein